MTAMSENTIEQELYRVDEVQRILGMSPTTVRSLIRDGQLPVVRIKMTPDAKRSMIRVSRDTIERFIRERTEAGEGN